jgi:hypothetical protein
MKAQIVEVMEEHPNSGYYAAEFASVFDWNEDEVLELLHHDDDFFWDADNEAYIGWRLAKYRNTGAQ